ncbi:MAG: Gfo/Idh/MocA family protein, partial [Armatimonadota bacterium]
MLHVGIAGLGRGQTAFVFNHLPDCQVTALCDINEDRLKQVGEQRGISQLFTRFEDLVASDVDAIFLATPLPEHATQASMALESGKHVLSEVAAGFTWGDLWLLAHTAARSPATYMMAENYCFMRHVTHVRSMVEAGVFGDIYFGESEYVHDCKAWTHDAQGRPTWRAMLHQVRGDMYPTHSLGPLYSFFKEPVREVVCFGSGPHLAPGSILEDCIITLCHTASGKLIKLRYDTASYRPPSYLYYAVQGTQGAYEAPRGLGDDHKVYVHGHTKENEWQPLSDFEEYLPEWYRELEAKAAEVEHNLSDYVTAWKFREAVLNNRPPEVDVWMSL